MIEIHIAGMRNRLNEILRIVRAPAVKFLYPHTQLTGTEKPPRGNYLFFLYGRRRRDRLKYRTQGILSGNRAINHRRIGIRKNVLDVNGVALLQKRPGIETGGAGHRDYFSAR